MASIHRFLALASAATCAVIASAQGNVAPFVTMKLGSPAVVANKPFQVILNVKFADGLHGYQNPPSDASLIPVTVLSAEKAFPLVSVAYPKGTSTKIGGMDKPVAVYQGTVQIPATFKAPSKLGKNFVRMTVKFQQCNESSCFPPSSISLVFEVNVLKKAPPVKATDAPKGIG